jgi:hypothetical protein
MSTNKNLVQVDICSMNSEVDVDAIFDDLISKLKKINDGYFNFADALSDAKKTCSENEYYTLLEDIGMSKNTALRHVLNARCPQLKQYRNKLRHIISWGTLTEISRLNKDKFKIFKKEFLESDLELKITRAQVLEIKNAGRTVNVPESTEYENFVDFVSDDTEKEKYAAGNDNDNGEEEWEKNWVGMPAFNQEANPPFKTIKVHLNSLEDYEDFQRKIEQKMTEKTKSIWHPKREREYNKKLRWVEDEQT